MSFTSFHNDGHINPCDNAAEIIRIHKMLLFCYFSFEKRPVCGYFSRSSLKSAHPTDKGGPHQWSRARLCASWHRACPKSIVGFCEGEENTLRFARAAAARLSDYPCTCGAGLRPIGPFLPLALPHLSLFGSAAEGSGRAFHRCFRSSHGNFMTKERPKARLRQENIVFGRPLASPQRSFFGYCA